MISFKKNLNVIQIWLILHRHKLKSKLIIHIRAYGKILGLHTPYHHHHHQFIYSTTEQYKYSDNVDTNEVETGMTRLIALTVTPVY